MSWIEEISPQDSTGLLREELDAALARTGGRIWKILRVMSINPPVLSAAMQMYGLTMFGESPLSRAQREMVGLVASSTNRCLY